MASSDDSSEGLQCVPWSTTLLPMGQFSANAAASAGVDLDVGVFSQRTPGTSAYDGEERVYWNEPDGLIIKKSEFGGILPKDWELNKDRLQGRFFYPDGNSLTWDVCARDSLRDFNLVCLKCGEIFACAANNMTRTGNRHIKCKHPTMTCIQSNVPFYKERKDSVPNTIDPSALVDAIASNRVVDSSLLPMNSSFAKSKFQRSSDSTRKRMDRHFSAAFTRCNLPTALIELPAFRDFVEELTNHCYTPCSKQTIEAHQEIMHTNLVDDIRLDVEKLGPNAHFAVTCDAFMFRPHSRLMILNLFAIDSKWQQLKATISIKVVPDARVSNAIDYMFRETVLHSLGIPPEKVISFASNEGCRALPPVPTEDTATFGHRRLLCSLQTLQAAYKSALYTASTSGPLLAVLHKFAGLAGYLLFQTNAQDSLTALCMDVDLPSQDFFGQDDTSLTADCEFSLLSAVYRFKPALVRGWGPRRDSIGGGIPMADYEVGKRFEASFEVTPGEWMVGEQLLAVLARVERTSIALGKSSTVCISKVYPELLALYRFLMSPDLTGHACAVPEIYSKKWFETEIDLSVKHFKLNLARELASRYPGLALERPLSNWTAEELRAFEPYLLAMTLDPTLTNSFGFFANPSLSEADNTVLVTGLRDAALTALESAACNLQRSWVRVSAPTHDSTFMPSISGSFQSNAHFYGDATGITTTGLGGDGGGGGGGGGGYQSQAALAVQTSTAIGSGPHHSTLLPHNLQHAHYPNSQPKLYAHGGAGGVGAVGGQNMVAAAGGQNMVGAAGGQNMVGAAGGQNMVGAAGGQNMVGAAGGQNMVGAAGGQNMVGAAGGQNMVSAPMEGQYSGHILLNSVPASIPVSIPMPSPIMTVPIPAPMHISSHVATTVSLSSPGLEPGVVASVEDPAVIEATIKKECKAVFASFAFNQAHPFAEPVEVHSLRKVWSETGAWQQHNKPPHLYWWGINQHKYAWVSALASIYLAIPASTSGSERFVGGQGGLSMAAIADSDLSDEKVEKLLLVKEGFYSGLLDTVEITRKRKRLSAGGIDLHSAVSFEQPRSAIKTPLKHESDTPGLLPSKIKVMKPAGNEAAVTELPADTEMPELGDTIRSSLRSQIKQALHSLREAAWFASHEYNIGTFRQVFADLLASV